MPNDTRILVVDDEIPPGARILAVADAFDAMTSDRPYREAKPIQEALAVIQEARGGQFCPIVSDAFLSSQDMQASHHAQYSHC